MVHHGANNCLREAKWFGNRNYAKRKILTFHPAFEYHDFVFLNVFTLPAGYFSHSFIRIYPYISGAFIYFALVFHDNFAYKTS